MCVCNTTTDGMDVPRLRVIDVEHTHRERVGAVANVDLHTSLAGVHAMRLYTDGERTAMYECHHNT